MDLLRNLTEGALEPEYRSTTAPRRTGWITFLSTALIVALLTYAVVQTVTSRDLEASERDQLLVQVQDARSYQDALSERLTEAEADVAALSASFLPDDEGREALARAELLSGAVAVTGPGIVVTADDAPDATTSQGRVLDSDLSYLVNALFEAGAEAVAINGRRVTTQTPIRSAGAAITVDYVSLSPPYTVEAIGNPEQLPGRFATTRGAGWWQYLRLNYGLTLDIHAAEDELELAADSGMGLRHATGG
ncbi:MAG: DUF881 domain-containing protein [Propionibacterium sp.]|nr:DUF881 domain-containing protein [Propionibacterium sp.]